MFQVFAPWTFVNDIKAPLNDAYENDFMEWFAVLEENGEPLLMPPLNEQLTCEDCHCQGHGDSTSFWCQEHLAYACSAAKWQGCILWFSEEQNEIQGNFSGWIFLHL